MTIHKIENLDESIEYYSNDYYEAKQFAENHHLIEAEYSDTGYMYGDQPISYVCYNKTGEQNGDYILTAYYTWKRRDENHHLKPSPIDDERLKHLIMY